MKEVPSRKLAVILHADVVGSTALVQLDEAVAHRRIRDTFLRLSQAINARGGATLEIRGDALVGELPSASDAVEAALSFQDDNQSCLDGLADGVLPVVRIGIAMGEVVVADGTVTGAAVVLAQRLEQIAAPGSVCIQGNAQETIPKRLPYLFESCADKALKGFSEPVRVCAVRRAHDVGATSLMTGGQAGAPALEVGQRPSIAVLPFANRSGDPEQEYFSDGLTEDIITALSRFKSLRVISRNSSFAIDSSSLDVREVASRLGVSYVVEGSVRKAGARVRVTGQLVEAVTGAQLWAERYDRELGDVFAVQDELVWAIAGAIPGQINRNSVARIRHTAPKNLTAYECELRGRWALGHWHEGIAAAIEWFEKSIDADPGYALAHAALAMAYVYGVYGLGLAPEVALERGKEHARRATSLDDRDPTVNAYAAFAYHVGGVHGLARKYAARAVELNPNDPFVLYVQGCALSYTGEPAQALEWFARSEELEPYAPDDQRLDTLCDCYYMLHQYEKIEEIHASYQDVPAFLYIISAIAHAQAGDMEKARAARSSYERLRPPDHDIKTFCKHHVQMCSRAADREHWLQGYRKAGFDV